MANRVNVTSVEAIESFRSALIVYLSKARPTLQEVGAEVTRTRLWVQTTQRSNWDNIFRKRTRQLEEAQAALFSAKMSTISPVTAAEQMAVTKAKRGLEEAQEKLRVLRRWDRDFDNQTAPLERQMEKLGTVLSEDMVNAVAHLSQILETLEAYAGIIAPTADGGSGQTAEQKAPDRLADVPETGGQA